MSVAGNSSFGRVALLGWLALGTLGLSGCTSTLHYLHRHTPVSWAAECEHPYRQCSQCGQLLDRHGAQGCPAAPAPFWGFSATYWSMPACRFAPDTAPAAPPPSPGVEWSTPAPSPEPCGGQEFEGRAPLQRLPTVAARNWSGVPSLSDR